MVPGPSGGVRPSPPPPSMRRLPGAAGGGGMEEGVWSRELCVRCLVVVCSGAGACVSESSLAEDV